MRHASARLPAVGAAALAGVLGIQLVGPERTNPPVSARERLEAHGSIPADVAATLRRACYDCHSNETRWPWYARLAPVSWAVVSDVNEGRERLNFSNWGAYHRLERADLLDESCGTARRGEMPLRAYTLTHREARLATADVEALCAWTRAEADRLAGGSPE